MPQKPRLRTVAFALALLALLALAACTDPAVKAVPTVTSTQVPGPTATPDPFASDQISCTPEVLGNRLQLATVLGEVYDRYRSSLAALPGTMGMGVGSIQKDGVSTSEQGIVIYFDVDFDSEEPQYRELVPTTLEGCPVHVKLVKKAVEV
jgi:hypothetical protein